MYKCLYCSQELIGNQRKYCNENHKGYYLRQQKFTLLKELKDRIPQMFKKDFKWNENDIKMIELYIKHKDDLQAYVDIILQEKINK